MRHVSPETTLTRRPPRVALVHHWLVRRRGGERVLEALAALWPGSDLFTLLHDADACPAPPHVRRVVTSAMQQAPLRRLAYRALLPMLPRFYRSFNLRDAEVVVTSDASVAKTVRVPDGAHHVCYCYSPVRYAWDLEDVYLERSVPRALHGAAKQMLKRVRRDDWIASRQVDRFVAVSRHAARRIERAYSASCDVVYPPVDLTRFTPSDEADAGTTDEAPYLLLGEAVAYKRFDLAVAACRELDRPLVVAGDGPHFAALRAAAGPRTRFVQRPTDAEVAELYRDARALLFPGEEDFGLVPVEAMACGTPVIALGRGGATETVQDGVTGVLYGANGDDVEHLIAAIRHFEQRSHWPAAACVAAAQRFSHDAFATSMSRVVMDVRSRPPIQRTTPPPAAGRMPS